MTQKRNWKKRLDAHIGRIESALRKGFDDRYGLEKNANKRKYIRSRQKPQGALPLLVGVVGRLKQHDGER